MIASTYSWLSFVGLVSSKRRWQRPPNSWARPKSMQIALAWPMCRYPFGSGGKRVITRPPKRPLALCSRMMSRTKLLGFSRASSLMAQNLPSGVSTRGDVVLCRAAEEGGDNHAEAACPDPALHPGRVRPADRRVLLRRGRAHRAARRRAGGQGAPGEHACPDGVACPARAPAGLRRPLRRAGAIADRAGRRLRAGARPRRGARTPEGAPPVPSLGARARRRGRRFEPPEGPRREGPPLRAQWRRRLLDREPRGPSARGPSRPGTILGRPVEVPERAEAGRLRQTARRSTGPPPRRPP